MGAVGVSAGRLLPVVERNTVVPVSGTKTVTPVQDF
jgi:molecular chaperone HscC